MITELKKSEFYKCRNLLNEQGQLEGNAIVEGMNPGRIFVDDAESPASGLIWLGNNDGFLFIGNERNERFNTAINHFIDTVITPEARKVGLSWFEAIGNHEKWNGAIKELFAARNLGSWNQKVYTMQKEDYSEKDHVAIEEGYSIIRMSESLLKDTSIKNIEFLQAKIAEFWSSPEMFFQKGIGCCAIYGDEIVSVCFSIFVVDHIHCINIETLKEHQGKKLAQQAAKAFVKECLENDQIPYWDCMESNKPSVAVAEKLGFQNVFNYIGYEFKLE